MLEGLVFFFSKKRRRKVNGATKILVISDNKKDKKITERVLNHWGYHTIITDNGSEGIRIAREQKPALIFLSYELSDIPGAELCQRFKSKGDLKDFPLVFITDVESPRRVIEYFELDAENYLLRPISPRLLISQIKMIMNRRSREMNPS